MHSTDHDDDEQIVTAGSAPVTVGVIVDGPQLPFWQNRVVQAISRLPDFAVQVFVAAGRKESPSVWTWIDAVEARLSRMVLSRRLVRKGLDCDATVSIENAAGVAPALPLPEDWIAGFSRSEPLEALAQGKALLVPADILVDLTTESVELAVGSLPRLGLLSFDFSRGGMAGREPPGFWSFYFGDDVTAVAITRRTARSTETIGRGTYRTHRFSWNENRRRLQLNAGQLMADAVTRLTSRRGTDDPAEERRGDDRGYGIPSLWTATAALSKLAWRAICEMRYVVFTDHKWHVFWGRMGAPCTDVSRLVRLDGEPGAFWADPFPVVWNGIRYVFFERYPFDTRKGVISYVRLPDDEDECGTAASVAPVLALEQDCHLSYPFLFEFENQVFMIPETSERGTVEVWEASNFPDGWHRRCTLLENVSAADSTLFQKDGYWWMLTNIDRSGTGDHCSELHVFHADSPLSSDWTAHPQNPVVVDARTARMAGAVFTSPGGGLFRSSQSTGRFYGTSVILNEIERLTTTEYRERPVHNIAADWDNDVQRTHHFATWQSLVAIDGCYNASKLSRWLSGLRLSSGPRANDLPRKIST